MMEKSKQFHFPTGRISLASTDSRGRKVRQPIEPTDIEIGKRLFIPLDPNGATAEHIEVLPAWNEMNCYKK
jgi:hypothetical protein